MNLLSRKDVSIVPFGSINSAFVEWLKRQLSEITGMNVSSTQRRNIPRIPFDNQTRRYLGNALLEYLQMMEKPGNSTFLGLIDADCYAEGLNYIFGQAVLKGQAAIVALARLRQSFYGFADNESSFKLRALKESVHEIGHTWGLHHCPDPHCVMHFSNSIKDTDEKPAKFCNRCAALCGLVQKS